MSFYRLVRWSRARVPLQSGRDIMFDRSKPVVFPCREQYRRDNETLDGIRVGKDAVDAAAEVCDEDDEIARVAIEPDVGDDGDPAVAEEEIPSGPLHVEFEPYPQHVADELAKLLDEESELAQTYGYIPTTVDTQNHDVDQFGVRIQRTTRPPYVSPQEWKAATPAEKDALRADYRVFADRLVVVLQRISDLKAILREYDERGGLRD